MSTTASDEFAVIERYFAPLTRASAGSSASCDFILHAFDLRDDAARIDPPAAAECESLVLTKDSLVGGVHFCRDDPPATIAMKLLGVNLSDLAAKGARPLAYLLSCGLPYPLDHRWLEDFTRGLGTAQKHYRIRLLGGDTVRVDETPVLTATLIGTVPRDDYIRRHGGAAGDWLYVSGTIGDAALGLKLRQGQLSADTEAEHDYLIDRYHIPQPRLPLIAALRASARAAIDLSDGLIADLRKLAEASVVDIELDLDAIPYSSAAKSLLAGDSNLLAVMLGGGDDYEIAAAIAADKIEAFESAAAAAAVKVTHIGFLRPGTGKIRVIGKAASQFGADFIDKGGGYCHF